MIKGYDISNTNGHITIPQDAQFVIAKVSQDKTFVDTFYPGHRDECRQREIGFGGYLYGDNKEEPNAADSCDRFIDLLGDQQEGEVGALDVEWDHGFGGFIAGNPNNRPWVTTWGERFNQRKGYKPYLYLSRAGISDFDLDHPEIADLYRLWLAHWLNDPATVGPPGPTAPSPFTQVEVWQYNADLIDKNVFLGTLQEFRATGMQIAPQPPSEDGDYEARYWTPIQKLLDSLVADSKFPHADRAFHAAMSNQITLHKIAVGKESPV